MMTKHGGWFRFYYKVVDDPKVQALSGDVFKTWANLLCIAGPRQGGALPGIADLAFRLRMSVKETEKHIDALIRARLIDETDGRFVPHDWNEMQFAHNVSTDRVQRFRKRKAETPHETP